MKKSHHHKILVAGITNLETTVRVEGFPIDYTKSRFVFDGITDRVGGVGYNVSRALAQLGAHVELATLLGQDLVGRVLRGHLEEVAGLGLQGVLSTEPASLRSGILAEPSGRAAMFTDLKNSQDIAYPLEYFRSLLPGVAYFHASNINWAFALAQEARRLGVPVSTDVQAIRTLKDDYNRRFLSVADWIFLSGENLEAEPRDVIRQIWQEFPAKGVIISLAEKGALLGERESGEIRHQPVPTMAGAVLNVTGAGDALAAGTLTWLARGLSPWDALLRGQLVAAHRIRQGDGGHGIPTAEWVEAAVAGLGDLTT